MLMFSWPRYLIISKLIILCESAPKLGHPLFDPLMLESKQSHIKLFLRNNNDNNQTAENVKNKKPCHGYDFDENDCRTVNNRVICGYNKNTGKVKNKESFEDMGDGCRIRGDRIECGYVTGPFLNPRRPPANYQKSKENEDQKAARENNHPKAARKRYYHQARKQNYYNKATHRYHPKATRENIRHKTVREIYHHIAARENDHLKESQESDQGIELMLFPIITSLLKTRDETEITSTERHTTKTLRSSDRHKTNTEINQTPLITKTSTLELKPTNSASDTNTSETVKKTSAVNVSVLITKLSANAFPTDASLFTTGIVPTNISVTSKLEMSASTINSNTTNQEGFSTQVTTNSTREQKFKTTTILPVTQCVEVDDRVVCYFTLPLKRKL